MFWLVVFFLSILNPVLACGAPHTPAHNAHTLPFPQLRFASRLFFDAIRNNNHTRDITILGAEQLWLQQYSTAPKTYPNVWVSFCFYGERSVTVGAGASTPVCVYSFFFAVVVVVDSEGSLGACKILLLRVLYDESFRGVVCGVCRRRRNICRSTATRRGGSRLYLMQPVSRNFYYSAAFQNW